MRIGISRAANLVVLLMWGIGLGGGLATAATLEQLSLEQMAQQSTEIVRGRVVSATPDIRNGVIYTRSHFQVLERWKGAAAAAVDISVPGGKLGKLQQTFAGSPMLDPGTEYVLFLWTGKSGVTQVIGLSQGVFDLKLDAKGQPQVARAAAAGTLLNSAGQAVTDSPVRMSLPALDQAIRSALAPGASK